MPDHTVYAGISPDTGKSMYTTRADAPGTYHRDAAKAFCATEGGRVPTKGELNALFQNRAAIGGFNETGSFPAGWYWSFSPSDSLYGWAQRFSDGLQDFSLRVNVSSLRCVR